MELGPGQGYYIFMILSPSEDLHTYTLNLQQNIQDFDFKLSSITH